MRYSEAEPRLFTAPALRTMMRYGAIGSRPHLQPWCAPDHRCDNNRFQLQQGDCTSTVSTECRYNTTRRNCAPMNKPKRGKRNRAVSLEGKGIPIRGELLSYIESGI